MDEEQLQQQQHQEQHEEQQQQEEKFSDQAVRQYSEEGVGRYDAERIAHATAQTDQSRSRLNAERLRINMAGSPPEGAQEQIRPAGEAVQAPNAYAGQSNRQSKKQDRRRERQQKQARKKYGAAATAETLPMAKQLRESLKEQSDRARRVQSGEIVETPWRDSLNVTVETDMFTKPPVAGQDTAIDVKGAMEQLRRMGAAIAQFDRADSEGQEIALDQRVRMEELKVMKYSMSGALETILAANGVDMKTGGPVSEERARRAAERKAEALKSFGDTVANRRNTTLDRLELYTRGATFDAAYDEVLAQVRSERESEDTYAETKDLPFTISYYVEAENLSKIRRGMDANPDRYAAHKDVIDRMFREYLDLENALANISLTAKTYVELGEKNAGNNSALYSMYNMLAERVTTTPESKAMYVRTATLLNMLRYLIEGRAMEEDWLHVMLEDEFGVVTAERQDQKDDLAVAEARAAYEASHRERLERWEHLQDEDKILADDPQVLDVCDAIMLDERRQKNSEDDYRKMGFRPRKGLKVDLRMIRTFTKGYDVNEEGEPLTEYDQDNKDFDMEFVEDYMSGDLESRRPHLDHITEYMLNIDVSERMLTEEYVRENPYKIHRTQQRMVYFENLVKENPDYYNSLSRATRAQIRHRFSIFAPFLNTQVNMIGARGIEYNRGRLYREGEEAPVEFARGRLPEFRKAYDTALPEYLYAEKRIRGFVESSVEQSEPQIRTQEEFTWLAALYPEARRAKIEFRDRFLQEMQERGELTDGAVRELMSNSDLYERMSLFLDENLPEEVNFRRVQAQLTFSRETRVNPDGQIPFPSAAVLDQLRDVCRERIEGLRKYQVWIDLTEDEIYDRAEEILRVQMAMEHIEYIANNTFNPMTGKSLWDELMDPELTAISFSMSSYKSAIRASALSVKAFMGSSTFRRVGKAWLTDDDETDTDVAFAKQEDRYLEMRRILGHMDSYLAMKDRLEQGDPPIE